MSDLKKLAAEITSNLNLSASEASDLLYPDVEAIVEGKLRDRYDKLIDKKIKDGESTITITEERISNSVHYATSRILERGSQEIVSETATYYRTKYEMV